MTKVYIFLTDGFEEIEGLTVVDLLRRAKIDIETISVTGKIEVTGAHNIRVTADSLFDEHDYSDATMLVLPGGPGTAQLHEHEGLDKLLREFHAKEKPLAAICAAPTVFGKKEFLIGKNATCFPGHEKHLIGANVQKLSSVVIDGNIITSKGMGTAIDFSLSLIKFLMNEDESNRIAAAIQYSK